MLAVRLALLLGAARAFYLPGVAPREYGTGERVELKVNKLTSTKTQAGDNLSAFSTQLSAHTHSLWRKVGERRRC